MGMSAAQAHRPISKTAIETPRLARRIHRPPDLPLKARDIDASLNCAGWRSPPRARGGELLGGSARRAGLGQDKVGIKEVLVGGGNFPRLAPGRLVHVLPMLIGRTVWQAALPTARTESHAGWPRRSAPASASAGRR